MMNSTLSLTRRPGCFQTVLVIFILVLCAPVAKAQFVPGPYFYPDAGVVGSISSAYQSAAQQQAYTANRQLQATSSMARSLAWQQINRTMQQEAMSRPTTVADSAQAAREWMYQYAPPSRSVSRPMTLPRMAMTTPQPLEKPSTKSAPQEIMLWPTILKDPLFDDDRASVEAPFRRARADGKPLTIEDYQQIIKTVESMKATIKTLKSQLVEAEYAAVEKYLDDLIADSQKRIKARGEGPGARD